jgi:hypothetical protein
MEKSFKATHRGYVTIGAVKIPCAVLENKKRIISQTGLFQSFERPRKGEVRQEGLPSILGAKNLIEFIDNDVLKKCNAIPYLHTNGKRAYGYDAELIPLICEVYLKAHDKGGVLHFTQEKIVERCRIIVRSLARIGITALIDEATGYQYDREQDELQKLLAAYIAEDYLKWQRRFPRKFYQEVFRLLGWSYSPLSVKRPSYLGQFTNKYIYKLMPPGVLGELKKKNPITQKGYRERRHHQHLTENIGIPHLDRHITKVITIMELSKNITEFKDNFNKVFYNVEQFELALTGKINTE